jgi:hypothetical protein
MSAIQEQAKPMLEEFIPQVYIPELDMSKLSGIMDKSWFFNQLVLVEDAEAEAEKPF